MSSKRVQAEWLSHILTKNQNQQEAEDNDKEDEDEDDDAKALTTTVTHTVMCAHSEMIGSGGGTYSEF